MSVGCGRIPVILRCLPTTTAPATLFTGGFFFVFARRRQGRQTFSTSNSLHQCPCSSSGFNTSVEQLTGDYLNSTGKNATYSYSPVWHPLKSQIRFFPPSSFFFLFLSVGFNVRGILLRGTCFLQAAQHLLHSLWPLLLLCTITLRKLDLIPWASLVSPRLKIFSFLLVLAPPSTVLPGLRHYCAHCADAAGSMDAAAWPRYCLS